jgi:hypothetical protein
MVTATFVGPARLSHLGRVSEAFGTARSTEMISKICICPIPKTRSIKIANFCNPQSKHATNSSPMPASHGHSSIRRTFKQAGGL